MQCFFATCTYLCFNALLKENLLFQVPVVHNVSVASLNDAVVEISDFMESAFCQVTADTGAVHANRIKTESLTIITNSGEIVCSGHIQGTVKISSATGNVVADQRFIGPSLDISTDSGDVSTTIFR